MYRETLVELHKSHLLDALQRQSDHRFSLDGLSGLLNRVGFSIRQVQRDEFKMRYLSGSSFLRHHFIQYGFMDGWRSILAADEEQAVFERLEAKLNKLAQEAGELSLTIPAAYIEVVK